MKNKIEKMHEAYPGLKDAWEKYQALRNDPMLVEARDQYHTLYKLLDDDTIRGDEADASNILDAIRNRMKN